MLRSTLGHHCRLHHVSLFTQHRHIYQSASSAADLVTPPLSTSPTPSTGGISRSSSGASIQPLVDRIKALPHRDISRIGFGELLQLYLSCRLLPSTPHVALERRGGHSDGVDRHKTAANNYDASSQLLQLQFDEWCLRSVFSNKWTEVTVDADVDLLQMTSAAEEPVQPTGTATSGMDVDKQATTTTTSVSSTRHASSLRALSQWENINHNAATTTAASSSSTQQQQQLSKAFVNVWTPSLFLAPLESYHATPGAGGRVESSTSSLVVRSNGTRMMEGIMRDLRSVASAASFAPPPPPSSTSTSTNTVAAPPPRTIWIPFSTLVDIRRAAFGTATVTPSGGATTTTATTARPAQHDTIALLSALSSIRQLLVTQQHVIMATNRTKTNTHNTSGTSMPPRVCIVPPTVELAATLRYFQAMKTNSSSRAATGGQAGGLASLCESSVVRWAALSSGVVDIHTTFPSDDHRHIVSRGAMMSLQAEGAKERKLYQELGASVTRNHGGGASSMPRQAKSTAASSNTHKTVLAHCSEMTKRLSQREEQARYAPRY